MSSFVKRETLPCFHRRCRTDAGVWLCEGAWHLVPRDQLQIVVLKGEVGPLRAVALCPACRALSPWREQSARAQTQGGRWKT